MGVTYGTASSLDALLAAANLSLAVWPAKPVHYTAVDRNYGTALMPNPVPIPSTLLLQAAPPLQLPSGTVGWVLVSDAAGNLTLQSPPGGPPSGAAGGDLAGSTYPNPTVSSIGGTAFALPVTVLNGGSGATTAAGARANFGTPAKANNLSDMASVNTCVTNLFANFAASVNYKPANPTATASTSLVMMGLGSTCVFTPKVTGIVKIVVRFGVQNNTAIVLTTIGCRYGTGTAPINGVAVTGTRFGAPGDDTVEPGGVNRTQPVSYNDTLALTAGTAYWFDVAALTANAADTVGPVNISVDIQELPY